MNEPKINHMPGFAVADFQTRNGARVRLGIERRSRSGIFGRDFISGGFRDNFTQHEEGYWVMARCNLYSFDLNSTMREVVREVLGSHAVLVPEALASHMTIMLWTGNHSQDEVALLKKMVSMVQRMTPEDRQTLRFPEIVRFGQWLLAKGLGIQSPIRFRYPFLKHKFRVQCNYFWSRVESGRWETEALKIAYDNAEGDVVDIGAWIGPYSLLMSRKARRVFSFEPDPVSYKEINYNLRVNGIKNVRVFNVAVSDATGYSTLRAGHFGSTRSSLVKGDRKSVSVKTITLDEACRKYGIAPTLIKIDVEGAEGLVMKGAERTIAKFKPMVLLEYHELFMTPKEAESNWRSITKDATKIREIQSSETSIVQRFLISYG